MLTCEFLTWEKIVGSLNKQLAPLAKDEVFQEDYAKNSNEFMDQLLAIRSTTKLQGGANSAYRKQYFCQGPGGKQHKISQGQSPQRDMGLHSKEQLPWEKLSLIVHYNCLKNQIQSQSQQLA